MPDRVGRLVAATPPCAAARPIWSRRTPRARIRRCMPAGTAIRLEARRRLEFQMHYTPTGTATRDRTPRRSVPVEGSVAARGAHQSVLQRPAQAAGRRGRRGGGRRSGFAQTTTLWDFSRTRISAARSGATCSCCPMARRRRFSTCPATTSTGRRTTCLRSRCRFRPARRSCRPPGTTTPRRIRRTLIRKWTCGWGDQTWEEMQYTGLIFSPGNAVSDRDSDCDSQEIATVSGSGSGFLVPGSRFLVRRSGSLVIRTRTWNRGTQNLGNWNPEPEPGTAT